MLRMNCSWTITLMIKATLDGTVAEHILLAHDCIAPTQCAAAADVSESLVGFSATLSTGSLTTQIT